MLEDLGPEFFCLEVFEQNVVFMLVWRIVVCDSAVMNESCYHMLNVKLYFYWIWLVFLFVVLNLSSDLNRMPEGRWMQLVI